MARLSTNFWTTQNCPQIFGLPKTVHEFFTFILSIYTLDAFIDTFYFFVHLSGKAYQKWWDCPRIFGLSTNFVDYPKLSTNFFTFILSQYPLNTFFEDFYFYDLLSGKAYQKWRDCPRIFGLSTNFLDCPQNYLHTYHHFVHSNHEIFIKKLPKTVQKRFPWLPNCP